MALGTLYCHCHLISTTTLYKGLPGGSDGKESACNAGAVKDAHLIPASGNPLEEGMETYSSILAWRILWAEEPGGLQFIGSQKSDMTETPQHACARLTSY